MLEVDRPLGVVEMGCMPLVMVSAGSGCLVEGIVERSQRDRGKREKVLLFSEAEESAEVVLGVPDGMRAFALRREIVFDQAVERW